MGAIAPSGASLGTLCRHLCMYLGAKLHMLYRSAQVTDILLPRWHHGHLGIYLYLGIYKWTSIYLSTSSVRLKLCCTAAPRLLIFSSLDGTSSVVLKLCCTAAPRLLIFSSLGGSSSVRLKLCCRYRSAQDTDILIPRWHQQRAPEVMLYRSAHVTDILIPRWHQQRAPEIMLSDY